MEIEMKESLNDFLSGLEYEYRPHVRKYSIS